MKSFYSNITYKYIINYFTGRKSLFRTYQEDFLREFGPNLCNKCIELGGEKKYNHSRFFTNASEYICSNINRDYDLYLDIANMSELADDSVDNFICISVFEHLRDYQKGAAEIYRVLRPGGKLLFTVPFLYPYHDEIDFWRFTKDGILELFKQLEIIQIIQFGGLFSTLSDFLQRPKGSIRMRFLIYKIIGLFLAIFGHFIETKDNYPLGYGLYAIKKPL